MFTSILNDQCEGFNLILQNLVEDCQRFMNVRQDAQDIEVRGMSHIKKVCQENKVKKKKYYS